MLEEKYVFLIWGRSGSLNALTSDQGCFIFFSFTKSFLKTPEKTRPPHGPISKYCLERSVYCKTINNQNNFKQLAGTHFCGHYCHLGLNWLLSDGFLHTLNWPSFHSLIFLSLPLFLYCVLLPFHVDIQLGDGRRSALFPQFQLLQKAV